MVSPSGAGGPESAARRCLFAVLGLATIAALFLRRGLTALTVFALVFGGLARLVEHDQAAARRRLGAGCRAADDGIGRGRHSDALRRPRLRLAHRQRLHRAWSKRSYDLSKLKTLDLFLAYWAGPEMAHVIMSFGFEDGDHIAWSVEVRREKTGEFSPVADAFRSHTLVYLATTERDSVRLRTNVRGEDVRLYRLNTPPDQARALLLEYVMQVDRARRAAEVVQFDHRQLRDRGLQDRARGRRDVAVRLAARRQRLSARLPLRPAGGGHDDAAQRTDGACADQRAGEGRRSVAGLLAGDLASACRRRGR